MPNTLAHTDVLCGTGDSDHSALLAKNPLEKVLLLKPGPELLSAPHKLNTLVAAAQLANFKKPFAIQTAELTQDLNADLDMLLELADETKADNPECTDVKALLAERDIDSVIAEGKAEKLQAMMIMFMVGSIAHHTCDYTTPSDGTQKRYQPRTIARQTKKDNCYRRALHKVLQRYKLLKGADNLGWQDGMRDVIAKTSNSLSADSQQAFPPAPETDAAYEWSAWKENCKHQQQSRNNRAKKAKMKTTKKLFAKAKQRIQMQYNTQPKQVHNMIFGKVAGGSKLTAVLDLKTGSVLNKLEGWQQALRYLSG